MSAAADSAAGAASAARLRGHCVMLRAGPLRLVLPQRDVGLARTLEQRPQAQAQRGMFGLGDGPQAVQVAALSPHLERLDPYPEGRFVMVQFVDDVFGTWYAWDEVRVLMGLDLPVDPLPPVMRGPGVPVYGSVLLGTELAFLTDGASLLAYVH